MGQLLCCTQVDQSTVAIKERFGKFDDVLEPGCHCLPWVFGSQLAGHLSLRLQQLDVRCETKTKSNLRDEFPVMSTVIRATVPKLNLDDAFRTKNEIAKAVEEELRKLCLPMGALRRQRKQCGWTERQCAFGYSVNVPGTTAKDVMDMVLVTQYFDTMKEIGATSKSSAVFIPHGPGAVRDVASQIRDGLLQGSITH
ncbi:hypothetical protein J5N97_013372 [Dioscorea zingiberensis]|uniref:Band 7 domain-containing protein n=1 Tax=Dioscorea zingiberensis TaxID=325984 RepID=A0A9D5HIR5_9LILI|nr:hypothetical protein J5N97_013372 [Dioscorea zingiberensis]